MNSPTTNMLLSTILGTLLCCPALAQVTVYNWIATDDVADWNVDENWDSDFGNAVPNAGSFEGETALINNGRAARAAETVPKVAGIEVRNGTVEIPTGGAVETVADDVASGGLNIGSAGSVNLGGTGKLTVAGNLKNSGTLRVSGEDASLNIAGDFATTGSWLADIHGDDFSTIRVDGAAALGGSLRVDIGGASPTLGQSWDLLKASSVSGQFETVDAVATVLPRGLQYRVNTSDGNVSLQVGNTLIATIDRQTGHAEIQNLVGGPIEFIGYALRSDNRLLAENWQGVLGDGWTVANPTAAHVAELSLASSRSLNVGDKIDLGQTYAGGMAHPDDEDLVFQYVTADGSLIQGLVEYAGPLNDLVLYVDPTDGSAAIANLSPFVETPDITSYAIRSDSGGLTIGTWQSLADSGVAGEGWTVANPTANHIAELNLRSSEQLSNGTLHPLGNILESDAVHDLQFEYTTVAGELLNGTVAYERIPAISNLPGDCNGDGQVNAADLACVGDRAERDVVLAQLNALPGDLDGDGNVAFSDFLTLSANFGDATKTSYVEGNIDLENGVAFPDFLEMSANFGLTPAAATAVPEPSSLALGLSLLALFAVKCTPREGRPA